MRRVRFRRRAPAWLYVLAIVAAVGVVGGIPYAVASKDARRPAQEELLTGLTLPPNTTLADLEEGRVVEVVDGDTIDVVVGGQRLRIRYYGIDTPERGDRCYREATDRNESLIGSRVLLLTDARRTDRFGRALRYVFLKSGVSVDATLVAEGFGRAWREDGRYREQIIDLETQAHAANRGCLWR